MLSLHSSILSLTNSLPLYFVLLLPPLSSDTSFSHNHSLSSSLSSLLSQSPFSLLVFLFLSIPSLPILLLSPSKSLSSSCLQHPRYIPLLSCRSLSLVSSLFLYISHISLSPSLSTSNASAPFVIRFFFLHLSTNFPSSPCCPCYLLPQFFI